MFKNQSIRIKLSATVAGVILISVLFQVFYFPARETAAVNRAENEQARILAVVLAHDLHHLYVQGELDESGEVLDALAGEPGVLYTELVNPRGEAIASWHRQGVTPPAPLAAVQTTGVRDLGDFFEGYAPLELGGVRHQVAVGVARNGAAYRGVWAYLDALLAGLIIGGLGLLAILLVSNQIIRRLGALAAETDRIASGDLSRVTPVDDSADELGVVAKGLAGLAQQQREMALGINDTVLQLTAAAEEFTATARQQEQGATEQSSAVEETQRTLDSLLSSGRDIANASEGVLGNAERNLENSHVMAERVSELARQVERIGEILELIKDIASKSELLALNAALEGTKAGEAGRGFSLVASQMQQLAEKVMRAVGDIRELTTRIREATQSSVLATEESSKIIDDTARSMRQIALIIQQQLSGTEQVALAMGDVSKVATQTASGSKQVATAATDILRLSETLGKSLSRFTL